MDKLIPVGTLVRVCDEAFDLEMGYGATNRRFVAEHGYLHIILRHTEGGRIVFKSLSTGHEHMFFFPDELEEAPTEEQADDQLLP